MMQQQAVKQNAYPRLPEIFFHGIKTLKLIGALFRDPRVVAFRKALFVLAVVVLAVILFFPDVVGELGLSAALPIVGTILGVPIDGSVDWAAFALLAVNLLRIFPADIVAEHYDEIFRRQV
ncbi:MAG: hypothetical protein M3Y39_06375 [Chloroflexota bacterium]|nr:hypothetical protein [Chloroflexota bacterium]